MTIDVRSDGAVATHGFPGRGVLYGVETYDGNHLPPTSSSV